MNKLNSSKLFINLMLSDDEYQRFLEYLFNVVVKYLDSEVDVTSLNEYNIISRLEKKEKDDSLAHWLSFLDSQDNLIESKKYLIDIMALYLNDYSSDLSERQMISLIVKNYNKEVHHTVGEIKKIVKKATSDPLMMALQNKLHEVRVDADNAVAKAEINETSEAIQSENA